MDYAFIHGRSVSDSKVGAVMAMNAKIMSGNSKEFYGILIDTCANRTSIIYKAQYMVYSGTFGVRTAMRPSKDSTTK